MRKRDARGVIRRVAAAGLAVLTAATMAVSSPLTAIAAEAGSSSGAVTLDKTATPLDENDITHIELTVDGDKTVKYSDVVFVIDRSTSVDVLNEAIAMVEELASVTNENNLVRVGVVRFETSATELLPLTNLTQDNVDEVTAAIEKADDEQSKGTNVQAGLYAGMSMLDGDTTVEASAKHLVLVTDGVTYLWGEGNTDSNAMTIYDETINNGEESLWAFMDEPTLKAHHDDPTTSVDESVAYYESFNNLSSWLSANGARIQADIDAHSHVLLNGGSHIAADELYQHESSTYYNADNGSFYGTDSEGNEVERWASREPGKKIETASNTDAAVYKAVTTWQQIEAKGYHSYAFASDKYASQYPWSSTWVSSLDTLDSNADGSITSQLIPADKTGMFDGVQSEILYSLGIGSTVHDVMGGDQTYDFDFVNDSAQLTIKLQSGETLSATKIAENTYGFGDQLSDGTYAYELVYYPEGTGSDSNDSFTLTFNVPVAGNAVTLGYAAQLVKAPTEPGDYKLDTNNVATLTPEGGQPTEFPVPTVDYTVEEPAPVTPDPITVSGDVFNVTKVLEGATLKDGQFEFQLADADGNVIATATNDAEGNVVFDDFTFEAAGTYKYTVSEVLPTDDDPNTDGVQKDGVTYDQTVEGLKLEVTEKDGKLTYQAYTDEDGATFNNVYKAVEVPAEDTKPADDTKKDETVPSTGDPTSFAAVAATLVAGVGAGAAGIAMRRRNK